MTYLPVIEVVVAVITRSNSSFLLARRPEGKPYAGYWEFPGGKIEHGESREHALKRELMEELGIHIELAYPWITRVFTYAHATVRLYFYKIVKWHGELHAYEKQELSWQFMDEVKVTPMLPANVPVLRALALPSVYVITNTSELGVQASLLQIENSIKRGSRMVQIREKKMTKDKLRVFAHEVVELTRRYGAQALLNDDISLSKEIGMDGVHLSSVQLMDLSIRPNTSLCGASCHNAEELFHAEQLDIDFVGLGPVLPTLSHPGAAPLGWRKFSALIRDYPLPVYALGGLRLEDLTTALEHGSQGIAMMRGWVES
jgi:8-oxo-dGTP diphosphatase